MKLSHDNLMVEGMIFCIKIFAIACLSVAVLNYVTAIIDKIAVITVYNF